MKILISGCSFTQWPEYPGGPNICWPRYFTALHPEHQIRNLAEPAAGNQYIADSVVRGVLEERPDMVLVMWTGVSRLDYLTSLEDPAWTELFDSYGFYRRLQPGNLGYIFSGGKIGTWFKNPVAHKMFYEMYKVSSDTSLGAINLMEIVKTQEFLKSRNIPYRFMSYVNYWTDNPFVSRNGDFGVLGNRDLEQLVNAIDFDKWIFTNERRDGLFELAQTNSDFQEDKFHPGDRTQEAWANFVSSKL